MLDKNSGNISNTMNKNPSKRIPDYWAAPQPINYENTSVNPDYIFANYPHVLTDYERVEITNYHNVYFTGRRTRKINGTCIEDFETPEGFYKVKQGDHIAYRYEVCNILGSGTFSQVSRCYDYKSRRYIAIKIIRKGDVYLSQGANEIRIMKLIYNADPDNTHCFNHFLSSFIFRDHLCIVTELLGKNLCEVIVDRQYNGLDIPTIQCIAKQVLTSLQLLKEVNIIHCDLKPENILVHPQYMNTYRVVKTVDLGSCLKSSSNGIQTYIQSRFYRAPEIILGIPFDFEIDMWSLGCILFELLDGYPLFGGESEKDQMALYIHILGLPSRNYLQRATRLNEFFFNHLPNMRLKSGITLEVSKENTIKRRLNRTPVEFQDFIYQCLQWESEKRLTVEQAFLHPFITKNYEDINFSIPSQTNNEPIMVSQKQQAAQIIASHMNSMSTNQPSVSSEGTSTATTVATATGTTTTTKRININNMLKPSTMESKNVVNKPIQKPLDVTSSDINMSVTPIHSPLPDEEAALLEDMDVKPVMPIVINPSSISNSHIEVPLYPSPKNKDQETENQLEEPKDFTKTTDSPSPLPQPVLLNPRNTPGFTLTNRPSSLHVLGNASSPLIMSINNNLRNNGTISFTSSTLHSQSSSRCSSLLSGDSSTMIKGDSSLISHIYTTSDAGTDSDDDSTTPLNRQSDNEDCKTPINEAPSEHNGEDMYNDKQYKSQVKYSQQYLHPTLIQQPSPLGSNKRYQSPLLKTETFARSDSTANSIGLESSVPYITSIGPQTSQAYSSATIGARGRSPSLDMLIESRVSKVSKNRLGIMNSNTKDPLFKDSNSLQACLEHSPYGSAAVAASNLTNLNHHNDLSLNTSYTNTDIDTSNFITPPITPNNSLSHSSSMNAMKKKKSLRFFDLFKRHDHSFDNDTNSVISTTSTTSETSTSSTYTIPLKRQ